MILQQLPLRRLLWPFCEGPLTWSWPEVSLVCIIIFTTQMDECFRFLSCVGHHLRNTHWGKREECRPESTRSAFEQSKTWTEPQLNLRSRWASCTVTSYPHFVCHCQVNQKRWKEKTDYENLLLLQKIQTVRPSRHVEGSVHFKRRSQS